MSVCNILSFSILNTLYISLTWVDDSIYIFTNHLHPTSILKGYIIFEQHVKPLIPCEEKCEMKTMSMKTKYYWKPYFLQNSLAL